MNSSEYQFQSEEIEPILYAVSVRKFVLLTISTLCIYIYFWAYKNFRWLEMRSGTKRHSIICSIFLTLTLFSLVQQVNEIAKEHGLNKELPAMVLAVLFFVLNILSRLPDPYGNITFLSPFILLLIQLRVNAINRAVTPNRPVDDHLGVFHWLFIVPMVSLIVIFLLIGVLAPEVLVSQ